MDSGNGLASYKRQAISWTNVDQTPWHQMAPLIPNMLNCAYKFVKPYRQGESIFGIWPWHISYGYFHAKKFTVIIISWLPKMLIRSAILMRYNRVFYVNQHRYYIRFLTCLSPLPGMCPAKVNRIRDMIFGHRWVLLSDSTHVLGVVVIGIGKWY